MAKAEMLSLGVHIISFGMKGDRNRIRNMIKCNHELDQELDPRRFESWGGDREDITFWPVGEYQHELVAVQFDETLKDFERVKAETDNITHKFPQMKPAMFPHLAALSDRLDSLESFGITWLVATNPNSLWRFDRVKLHATYLSCRHYKPWLRSMWLALAWAPKTHFLYYLE